jgi:hypothetical protein
MTFSLYLSLSEDYMQTNNEEKVERQQEKNGSI